MHNEGVSPGRSRGPLSFLCPFVSFWPPCAGLGLVSVARADCAANSTSLICNGFSGTNAFVSVPGWASNILSSGVIEFGGFFSGSCALAPSALSLRAAGASAAAFEASFSFAFNGQDFASGRNRGLTFVLADTGTFCGAPTCVT